MPGYVINRLPSNVRVSKVSSTVLRSYHLGVRDNIEAFGGDSGNIVAIGQSVGATSIGLHLVSYRGTQGVPFQKAL